MPLSQSDELIACEQNNELPKCNTEPHCALAIYHPARAHDRGARINDYSNTSHSNATPSGSFSNLLFCGIHICEYLEVVFVSDLLARVDVYENSHWSFVSFASAAPKPKLSGQVR